MPLVLYVDEQLAKDPSTREVRQITLSYTFFRQSDLSPEEVEAARDLKAGSQAIDSKLKRSDRKSVVEGKSVSVRVDLGGRRIIKQKNKTRVVEDQRSI